MIGVLDIQGSVEEHVAALKRCGVIPVLVKSISDLEKISGLIIPGGESTVIGKLLNKTGLLKEIRKRASKLSNGTKPLFVWGTCAGAILLAKTILNKRPEHLGLMNIRIMRNAYGRQMDSFETELDIPMIGKKPFPAVFIRAPKMKIQNGFFKAGRKVEILASYGGELVMAKEGNLLVTMFHPELTFDLRIHQYFINAVTHRTIHQRAHQTIAKKRQARRIVQNAQTRRARV